MTLTELTAHIDTSKDKRGTTHRLIALDGEHLFCRDCQQHIAVPIAALTPAEPVKRRGQPTLNHPDACQEHPGNWIDTCGPCRSERLAPEPPAPTATTLPGSTS